AVSLADVNGDGRADLAVGSSFDNKSGILLGNGNGTFATPQNLYTGGFIATGNLNGDSQIDLAIVSSVDKTLTVYLGNGNGTFAASQNFATGAYPGSVTVLNLNGDGHPDLAIG